MINNWVVGFFKYARRRDVCATVKGVIDEPHTIVTRKKQKSDNVACTTVL